MNLVLHLLQMCVPVNNIWYCSAYFKMLYKWHHSVHILINLIFDLLLLVKFIPVDASSDSVFLLLSTIPLCEYGIIFSLFSYCWTFKLVPMCDYHQHATMAIPVCWSTYGTDFFFLGLTLLPRLKFSSAILAHGSLNLPRLR